METNNSQIVIYQAPDGDMSIDVTVQNETVWLSQGQMAELFDKDQSVIARHISNVFKEGELEKESNMQILHNTLSKVKLTYVTKSATLSKAPSVIFAKHSAALTSTHRWKKRQPCSCISSRRTTPSAMATNALPPHCSYGFSTATAFSIMRTAQSALPTTPLLPSL